MLQLTASVVASVVLCGGSGDWAAAATKVTFGMPTTPPNMVHIGPWVAKEQGFFAEEGLDVEIVTFEGGVYAIRNVVSGALDVGGGAGASVAVSVARKAGIKSIYSLAPKFASTMTVRSNIKTLQDLKGKKIANDPDLKDFVKQNRLQTREIVLQLDPLSAKKAVTSLQRILGSQETDLPKLLSNFFDTDDANFSARYQFFYSQLAPLLELYRLKPGDRLTIKAYTKSGYVQAVNVKVYGTFQFKGLEKSGMAGALSLMDLFSFRDLYGYITPEKIAETHAMQQSAGATFVSRDKAEAELFDGASTVTQTEEKRIDVRAQLGGEDKVQRADIINRFYSQEEIEKGVVLGAAILLKDPAKLKETIAELQMISDKEKLGLKVIDWQKAAVNLGQFVFVAKIILFFATAIIFVVALVIINNAVVMATLQRAREIGTLRAIGARKGFVLTMVLTETVVLGLVFGVVGAAMGSALVVWLGQTGIAAGNDFLYFFFSGPRLFPNLSGGSVVGAFIVVIFVTAVSALYPAFMAARISPIQAISSED
jgi:ABC-type antimicrobial peptide transport system permease subunit